ncbi:MAG TPA: helix-turn-helix domain-containing protein [Candidatus Saccharimonadia bacterium]|nr:helix-turn-helix domain-containing protein [Candidatus Saccharimonadia bacterium]
MTSRTNRRTEGRNQGGTGAAASSDLEHRRQRAVARYLDGDPIAVICREMRCAKSWLDQWKKRYQATEPDWMQERSRRPESSPTKPPEALEAEILRLSQTLSPDGAVTVSARVMRDHLRHDATASLPSLRTIYRMLNRQTKEVASPSPAMHNRHANLTPRHMPR